MVTGFATAEGPQKHAMILQSGQWRAGKGDA